MNAGLSFEPVSSLVSVASDLTKLSSFHIIINLFSPIAGVKKPDTVLVWRLWVNAWFWECHEQKQVTVTRRSIHLGLLLNFPASHLIVHSYYAPVLASFVPGLEIMELEGPGWSQHLHVVPVTRFLCQRRN